MKLLQALSLVGSFSLLGSCFFITQQLRCDEDAPITCSDDLDTEIQCQGGNLTFTACAGDELCVEGTGCEVELLCGNDVVDAGEDCDGNDLDDNDCASVNANAPVGALACNNDCTFDTSQCLPEDCGDGNIDPGEDCDGNNLGGADCADVDPNLPDGQLNCNANCTFDASQCVAASCNNDGVADPGEECDGADVPSCDQAAGLPDGAVTCINCIVDISQCFECGDNTRQGPEECDDGCGGNGCQNNDNLDGCSQDCQLEVAGSCDGLGSVNGNEFCDGADLDDFSCETLGFEAGNLACDGTCSFDVSGCN